MMHHFQTVSVFQGSKENALFCQITNSKFLFDPLSHFFFFFFPLEKGLSSFQNLSAVSPDHQNPCTWSSASTWNGGLKQGQTILVFFHTRHSFPWPPPKIFSNYASLYASRYATFSLPMAESSKSHCMLSSLPFSSDTATLHPQLLSCCLLPPLLVLSTNRDHETVGVTER